MPKKKVNKRKDYDAENRDVTIYERSRIQRKMDFLILRGPGLTPQAFVAENEQIKAMAASGRFRVKFVQTKTDEEVIKALKEANTWAGGVVYNSGSLTDKNAVIKAAVKRLLIPVIFSSAYLEGLAELVEKQPKK
jgi:phosphohistidine swiveling domain-containing protein